MREKLTGLLRPLVQRCHLGHCWIKTKKGPRRIDEPFDEVKLSEHVMGGNAYGLCPIAPGESTTRVAVLDFDSHKGETPWPEMLKTAEAVAGELLLDGCEPVLFRSSGGHGIHIYLVWNEPQDAYSVREMLRKALEICGLVPGTGGVAQKQVEIFPKQNEVPTNGYGSMFILPLSARSEPLGEFSTWASSHAVEPVPRPVREEPKSVPQSGATRLRSALEAIPNDTEPLSYDPWRNVIFAIHYATDGSDVGLAIAHEFSARSGKYDADFLDNRVWPYISTERGGALVTDATVFALAESHGWIDPETLEAFDVVESQAEAFIRAGKFAVIPEHEFTQGVPPAWIVKGVIPDAQLVVVFGEPGSGKSFLAFDLLAAVARGVEWRGLKTKQGRCVYIAAEGASHFRNRIKAYKAQHSIDRLDVGVIPDAPNFMKADDIKALTASLQAFGPISLVVVDTFAQVMPGANENSGEDVGKALAHCRYLHKTIEAPVILVHHAGKDASKGARGWSGLRAAADTEIEISRCDEDRVATVTKMKDGEEGLSFGFKLVTVPVGLDEDGDVVSSCIVEHTEAAPRAERNKKEPKGKNEKRITQAVQDLSGLDGAGPTVSEVIDETVAQTPFDAAEGKRDRRREMALKALDSLVEAGRLSLVDGRVGVVELA